MSQNEEMVEDFQEEVAEISQPEEPQVETYDPRKTLGAYKRKMLLFEEGKISVPFKEYFYCGTVVKNKENGVHSVIASQDFEPGDIVEECSYVVLESRLLEFTERMRDTIALRYLWTLPCDDDQTFMCEEFGPHLVLPSGNATMYKSSDSPNCYFQFDDVTRTIRFYTLKKVSRGDELTVNFGPGTLGPTKLSAERFSELTGGSMVGTNPDRFPQKKGGCGCGAKKKFREVSGE